MEGRGRDRGGRTDGTPEREEAGLRQRASLGLRPAGIPPSPPLRRGTLDLLVVGHTNRDVIVWLDRLPGRDRTVPALEREERLGGTAANIARWAVHLGVRGALASFVGPDFPRSFREILAREGVGTRELQVREREFTPTCWIFEEKGGGQCTVIDQGAMEGTRSLPLPEHSLRRCALVHLATGEPDYQLRVAERARELGCPVTFDPAQEIRYRWRAQGLRRMLRRTEILFANEKELGLLMSRAGFGSPQELVGEVPLLLVTRGARGARAYTREGRLDLPAHRVRTLYRVTGAGDAFRGGFYAGWFRGESLRESLDTGLRAAARAIQHRPGGGEALPSMRPPPRGGTVKTPGD